ncbi:MAG: peptidoglycan bridge formation glycyltransferase FemA/FemB family protein [Bacilli bacterium]|nr:peptidoglycan bridge formation glycyltransferase FemA/FemB family protein [Bacilli bacterium]
MEFCILKEDEFRNFLNTSEQKTFLQTPEIGKLREKSGWTVHYLGVKKDKKTIAAAMFVSITRHFGYKEFYSPRGLLVDYHNKELLSFFTENIKKYVKKNKGYEFRIDPYVINIERDTNGDIVENGIDNTDIRKNLSLLGYKQIKKENMEQVGWMYVLDIDKKTEDEVLKNMKPNTRNTIRKTLKNGIEIIELSKEDLPLFHKIMIETGERKGFSIRKLKYFEDMYDLFHPRGEIKYLLTKLDLTKHIKMLEEDKKIQQQEREKLSDAKYNDGKRKAIDTAISGIEKRINHAQELKEKHGNVINLSSSMFIMTEPEIVYLSSGNYEEFMSYNSQYLIQWEMIKYGINHGFKRYNFYGITGNFDKNDKDYGIYEFKTGFNGFVEELVGEFAYPTSFIYYIINLIHKIKK